MTEKSIQYAQVAINAFKTSIKAGDSLSSATRKAIDDHYEVSGMDDEGNPEIRIWHALYSLVAYSDHSGFFRDQVFGEPQAGGPIAHKMSNGIREICQQNGCDFAELYRDVCENIDQFADNPVPMR